ncbi:nucleoside deaminase [Chitinophaga horti]|uniref:Nucleoside deaminase n=1 Tax=Chitinophaga horti TaxID=2920382 RepID=A0ABY6J1Y3_9BACT|nr:nucleoside deaminase [Chitinophaga horti]UYQ93406.1 nucleoside deaminase [Chitinophaga horti]
MHEQYMQRCLELARLAKQQGESPVGSIVVKDGLIIGEGVESSKAHLDITWHAEIVALRAAIQQLGRQDLSGSILYTTHEPCIMCSYMVRHTKVSTVVMGLETGALGGVSSEMPLLTAEGMGNWVAPPEVVSGVLREECEGLHG